jgi:outer membrane lipopolysaccharide assembly protein LptE/RlpB
MNAGRISHVRILLIVSLLMTVMASGCGYTIQGKANLPFEAIALGEIKNSTAEPKLQDRMNRLLAETFMEYGVDIRSSARYKIEGSINTFSIYPVAEKNLQAVEYQIGIIGNFRVIDTQTKKTEALGDIGTPYLVYFRSTGLLVNVLAEKETATEKALKDLSQEIVMRLIYKLPPSTGDKEKKGEQKIEPKTVPAGK